MNELISRINVFTLKCCTCRATVRYHGKLWFPCGRHRHSLFTQLHASLSLLSHAWSVIDSNPHLPNSRFHLQVPRQTGVCFLPSNQNSKPRFNPSGKILIYEEEINNLYSDVMMNRNMIQDFSKIGSI